MNVEELFRRLSYGELSNLFLGSEGTGAIPEEKQPKIVQYLNEALLRLYSRFVLSEKNLVLRCSDHIINYRFSSAFALSNPDRKPFVTPYIQDKVDEPFLDDLIKVLSVHTIGGCQVPLNDNGDPCSLFTPQPAMLQIPKPVEGEVLAVIYQAKHPLIDYGNTDALVDIPPVLEHPLRAYIAHLAYTHMNGQENSAKAAEYLATYEMLCSEVIERDLVNSSLSTTTYKLHERGFV